MVEIAVVSVRFIAPDRPMPPLRTKTRGRREAGVWTGGSGHRPREISVSRPGRVGQRELGYGYLAADRRVSDASSFAK